MNRYDDRARLVFHFAREEGSKLGHAMIGPEHLLLGLMREGGNASRVLADFGATLEGLRRQVEEMVGKGDGLPRNETAAITPRARRVMELAGSEARSLGSNVIATEHILLGVIREGDGVAYRILQQLTRDVDTVRWRILAANEAADASGSAAHPYINSSGWIEVAPPNEDEEAETRLRFDPGGWDETYLGLDKLSPVAELKLGLRLLGRGVRHLFVRR